jgi:hypothetical protein
MTKLHELLAAEGTAVNAAEQLQKETLNKFEKVDSFFSGHTKTLELHNEVPNKDAQEDAARQDKALATTVPATLDYMFKFWAKAEDLIATKNLTNTRALADLVVNGKTVATEVPVDELMGLEVRLGHLRKLLTQIPTLDASRDWKIDTSAAVSGTWKTVRPVRTTKTEKITIPVVLYDATDKHPAQVKESSSDKVVGTFTQETVSGATTAIQKANVLAVVDDLLIAVKQARVRANQVDVINLDLGRKIADLIMEPLRHAPTSNQV